MLSGKKGEQDKERGSPQDHEGPSCSVQCQYVPSWDTAPSSATFLKEEYTLIRGNLEDSCETHMRMPKRLENPPGRINWKNNF